MNRPRLGATLLEGDQAQFRVWAPLAEKIDVHLVHPENRLIPLQKDKENYFQGIVEKVPSGSRYRYRLNGENDYADPASRFQPEGIHGPSEVIPHDFPWEDHHWKGIPLRNYILYELHVGTFSAEGTFEAVIPHLDRLKDLGVTAVEVMPIAQFPGKRNWGYDGVFPYAAQNSYGGPQGFRRLVNACHLKGLALVVDVVYNHLGPEGNVLDAFGPYFTDRYHTPWGKAVNYDGPDSAPVRHYVVENALFWLFEMHADALRLDAIHGIFDASPKHILAEIGERVQGEAEKRGEKKLVIAESDLNDSRIIRPRQEGGYGLDAQWTDDFHHALHTLLTSERNGYYQDFGRLEHLAKSFREGYVYTGEHSVYRNRPHGNASRDLAAEKFVVYAQTHDQVGNRLLGERLTRLVCLEAVKLAAGVVFLSPYIPLLFMGEEYGETAPFLYFIDHLDPGLVEAVRKGREKEFAAFSWKGKPADPKDPEVFKQCQLAPPERWGAKEKTLFAFYRELIRLRKTLPVLSNLGKTELDVIQMEKENLLCIRRWHPKGEVFVMFHFGENEQSAEIPLLPGVWERKFDSTESRWGGEGSSLPEQLKVSGKHPLTLPPQSFSLWAKR